MIEANAKLVAVNLQAYIQIMQGTIDRFPDMPKAYARLQAEEVKGALEECLEKVEKINADWEGAII